MPVTAYQYGQFLKNALGSTNVNLLGDSIKVMLCSSSYTPNQDTHQFKSDVTGEVSGQGYTAGGAALTNKTLTYDADSNAVIFDADDVVWSNSTITARYAVLYDDSTGANDNQKVLIGYVDFGQNMSSSNGDFKIVWDSSGILKFTAQ